MTRIEESISSTALPISAVDVNYRILHFSWGPAPRMVEIWSAIGKTYLTAFPAKLMETVTPARAMQLYQHPGHYILS